jgi:DNA repair and recombination RAD54-like protein
MGLRGFDGQGCILADDMGLGKTLMSITVLWTLLNQGFYKTGQPAVKKIMVVCPTSLVGNWDNEIRKWIGDHCPVYAVKTGEPKKMIKNYLMSRQKGVLIISYETQRLYSKMFETPTSRLSSSNSTNNNPADGHVSNGICDLLICDEAHKLKNAESGLSKSLNLLPVKKRILLSGTPMQNELEEFYNMVNFCNPNVLGNVSEFRRK